MDIDPGMLPDRNVMELMGDPAMYANQISPRGWLPWIWSGVLALSITAAIFTLMSTLLHPALTPVTSEPPAAQVNVIRIQRPDTPVAHKSPKPPVCEPQKPKPLPAEAVHRQLDRKLTLPFEINPKLPQGPTTMEIPTMVPAVLNDFGLPNIFNAEELDQPLITLTRMPPLYPLNAKQRNIQGFVKVRFVVTAQGTVENVIFVAAQPPGVFEQSVSRCVTGWRFRPGTVEGVPVNTWAETTVKFELKQDGCKQIRQ